MNQLYSIKELEECINKNSVVIAYFSNESCSVCKILKPRISDLIAKKFPKAELFYIDIEKSPVISGQYRVFAIPTIDVYIQGKEHARFSRNITMHDFEKAIQKPYDILFS